MDKMKTRFIIAVTGRLAAAEDSTAKVELIEELSDNLFSRYQDLVADGMPEEAAYAQALEELGDVDELLAYLDSLGPDGELPGQESTAKDFTNDLLHGVEEIVRETVSQTKDAVDQAAVIVRNVADKIKEKYPNGFKGKVYVHIDGDDEAPSEEAENGREAAETDSGWSFAAGYNRDRGGFFCETNQSRRVTGTSVPSSEVKAVDIQIINGDVTIHLDDDPQADILLDGDVDHLEVRVTENGVLSIRQGKTASSTFFFLRGLASADVELCLPRRFWESIQISATNGDVEIDDGLQAGRLSIRTANGDVHFDQADCREISFKSASGDLDCSGVTGDIQAETASGDITLAGAFGAVKAGTASGDLEVTGSVRQLRCSSASGDLEVRTDVVPQQMEVHSKSGDCQVRMPGGEGFSLQFSTVSGDLNTDFPLVGPIGARSGEAMYLDGGGRTFHVSSISGDISLHQL